MMPRFQPGEDEDLAESDPNRESQGERGFARPQKRSGLALASLICALLGWFPMIPSMFATTFGMIALRDTRHRALAGRGMALAGTWLGLIGLGVWSLIFYVAWSIANTEEIKARATCTQFVQALADGKVEAALADCVPGTDRKPLEEASAAMKNLGPFNNIAGDFTPIMPSQRVPTFRWEVNADAVFSRGDGEVRFLMFQEGNGYKIERFDWKLRGK